MSRSFIVHVISFVLFLVLQIFLFKKLVLFNSAFCFLYVAFVLLLPFETSPLLLLFVAFVLGLLVDVFYDRQGMHAAATVAIAYLRNYWIRALSPQGGYDDGASPTLSSNGLVWFLSYSMPLIAIHHLILFFIDAGGFGLVGITLVKSLASLFFTTLLMVMHQYLFFSRSRL